jgi:SAM-dependent methyltransferase
VASPLYLEIGIGCGIYTQLMAKRGNVVAVDINPAFVDLANQMRNVIAHVADITTTSLAPIHDIAVCSEVLEHVPDSRSSLKNIYSSLKPGGYLVLTTPNSYSTMELTARLLAFGPVVKLAKLVYGEPVDDLGHINRMTRQQLQDQIHASGFEVIRQDNVAFYLPLIAEFGGHCGASICQWLAKRLERSPLSSLLWTQCWLLRRPLV